MTRAAIRSAAGPPAARRHGARDPGADPRRGGRVPPPRRGAFQPGQERLDHLSQREIRVRLMLHPFGQTSADRGGPAGRSGPLRRGSAEDLPPRRPGFGEVALCGARSQVDLDRHLVLPARRSPRARARASSSPLRRCLLRVPPVGPRLGVRVVRVREQGREVGAGTGERRQQKIVSFATWPQQC